MTIPLRCLVAASVIALFTGGCATGLRPFDSRAGGARLALRQDEVQGSTLGTEETAPAGTYVAEFENDRYVFYRGSQILERHNLRRWTARGGIAVSKLQRNRAVLYTEDPLGVFLYRPVHASFAIR